MSQFPDHVCPEMMRADESHYGGAIGKLDRRPGDGTWWALSDRDGEILATSIRYCPFCGVELEAWYQLTIRSAASLRRYGNI